MINSKFQAPKSKQNSKYQIANFNVSFGVWNLCVWSLFGIWDLEFGVCAAEGGS
jgi:hypothetical protein